MNRPEPSPRLQAMFDDLNERYFAGILDCKVVIGRLPLFPGLIEGWLTEEQRADVERAKKEDAFTFAEKHRKKDPPHGPKWIAEMERLVFLGETWAHQEIAFHVVREAAKEREAER